MHAPIAAPCFGSKLSSQMDDASSPAPGAMPGSPGCAGGGETVCSALPLTDAKEWCHLKAGQCDQLESGAIIAECFTEHNFFTFAVSEVLNADIEEARDVLAVFGARCINVQNTVLYE